MLPTEKRRRSHRKAKQWAKTVSQVMTALKSSTNAAGPTMTDIVKFISASMHCPATKRQVCATLKRGIEFGVLKRRQGHYLISSPEEDFAKAKKSRTKAPRQPMEKAARAARLTKRSRGPSVVKSPPASDAEEPFPS